MGAQLVPFGKYKGQPVEAMLSDVGYCSWLSEQPWLKDKFPVVQTLIINNFGEPDETPEHNAFQASFYDEKLVNSFVNRCCINRRDVINAAEFAIRRERKFLEGLKDETEIKERAAIIKEYNSYIETARSGNYFDICYSPVSEECGWDIMLKIQEKYDSSYEIFPRYIFLELKPVIADDFPGVLRQVKNNIERVNNALLNPNSRFSDKKYFGKKLFACVYKEFSAVGASENVVRTQFEQSGIGFIHFVQKNSNQRRAF